MMDPARPGCFQKQRLGQPQAKTPLPKRAAAKVQMQPLQVPPPACERPPSSIRTARNNLQRRPTTRQGKHPIPISKRNAVHLLPFSEFGPVSYIDQPNHPIFSHSEDPPHQGQMGKQGRPIVFEDQHQEPSPPSWRPCPGWRPCKTRTVHQAVNHRIPIAATDLPTNSHGEPSPKCPCLAPAASDAAALPEWNRKMVDSYPKNINQMDARDFLNINDIKIYFNIIFINQYICLIHKKSRDIRGFWQINVNLQIRKSISHPFWLEWPQA
ncbi:MAG: hypothetical protein RLZZ464_542 [Pseudomonadota bacterium]